MTVLIIVPVLKRPHRVQPLVESIEHATPGAHRTLFVCTSDDADELAAVAAATAHPNVDMLVLPGPRQPGDYARKINHAYRESDEPVMFLAADDLIFHPGWYEAVAALLTPTVEVVGTNDLGNQRVMNGGHSTHTLVTRHYVDERGTIDRPGEVLCEQYNHWYVDDEFVQTAQARGAFASCLDSIVEHLHPAWKKGETDEVYRLGQRKSRSDSQVYRSRQARIQSAA